MSANLCQRKNFNQKWSGIWIPIAVLIRMSAGSSPKMLWTHYSVGVSHFFPSFVKQEVKVIWEKAPHGGPIPRLGVTPGGRNLYDWIPGVGVPISVP